MRGTLERPIAYDIPGYHPLKCEECDSMSFAVQLPNDLDEYYESLQTEEERKTMFPKLFSGISEANYYHYVPLTCAKCGTEVEGGGMFRSLADLQRGNWMPPNERNPSGVGR